MWSGFDTAPMLPVQRPWTSAAARVQAHDHVVLVAADDLGVGAAERAELTALAISIPHCG